MMTSRVMQLKPYCILQRCSTTNSNNWNIRRKSSKDFFFPVVLGRCISKVLCWTSPWKGVSPWVQVTVPFIVRIIIFPVVFGSKLLSHDFEDVLAVTRNLLLMGKYAYEIMKNMGRVWSRDKTQVEENRKWKNWPGFEALAFSFKHHLAFKSKAFLKQTSRLAHHEKNTIPKHNGNLILN